MREAIERVIAERIIRDALSRGWFVSVHDGGEWVLRTRRDVAAILAALGSTDADTLVFRSGEFAEVRLGCVLLIWGNACDVVADWTDAAGGRAITELVQPILDDLHNAPEGWHFASEYAARER